MALSAEQIEILKYVDDATKSTISGYTRQTQKSCNLKQAIPSEIVQIILLFYYLAEHFDIHSKDVNVLGDYKDTIQKKGGVKSGRGNWCNMTFGAVSIPSMSNNIIVWTFKMLDNYYPNNNGLILGIINSKDANIESTNCDDGYQTTKISSYLYVSSSSIYHKGKNLKQGYGEELGHKGTTIKMTLNLKKGKLSYSKNDRDFGEACEIEKGEDIEYKMVVGLYWQGAKFQLVNFEYLNVE